MDVQPIDALPLVRRIIAVPDRQIAALPANSAGDTASASDEIDAQIGRLADWRGDVLARIRQLIREAEPNMAEEVKWRKPSNPSGVPVWSHAGMICTGETYRDKIKLTFAKGAALPDPAGLFNASLDGNVRRAIDIHDGQRIDAQPFKALIRAAVALNAKSR